MILRFLNSMQNGTIVALERLWKVKYIVISRAKHFHLSKKKQRSCCFRKSGRWTCPAVSGWESTAQAGDTGLTPGPEGPTRHGAAEPTCCTYGFHVPRAHAAQQEKPQQWKPVHHSYRVDPTRFNQRKLTQQQRGQWTKWSSTRYLIPKRTRKELRDKELRDKPKDKWQKIRSSIGNYIVD